MKTLSFTEAVRARNKLRSSENIKGPLSMDVRAYLNYPSIKHSTYHRSQSRKPSLIAPCKRASASGSLLAIPRRPPAIPLSPLSKPPKPPSRCSIPPSRYRGISTKRIFSHDARKSLDKVSHTDSSIVLVGARRSSPWIASLRYALEDDGWILPVKGARSDSRGSSRSLIFARGPLTPGNYLNVYTVPSSGSIKSCSIELLPYGSYGLPDVPLAIMAIPALTSGINHPTWISQL